MAQKAENALWVQLQQGEAAEQNYEELIRAPVLGKGTILPN